MVQGGHFCAGPWGPLASREQLAEAGRGWVKTAGGWVRTAGGWVEQPGAGMVQGGHFGAQQQGSLQGCSVVQGGQLNGKMVQGGTGEPGAE